ncbi:MAG: L-threonylcarbamoyladenylate synthase [Polyangiales bacterium]
MIVEIDPQHPDPRKIRRVVDVLNAGQVIAFPTDTTYALGCDLLDRKAIERIYQMKNMRTDQPLAFVVHDLADIAKYALVDNQQYRILRRLLPGPYTFILQSTREVPKMLLMKRKQVGIRMPDHPVIRAISAGFGRPIIASTAGPHGGVAMIDPHEIDDEFSGLGLVIDAGVGGIIPTTVVDLTHGLAEVLREGLGDSDLFRGAQAP